MQAKKKKTVAAKAVEPITANDKCIAEEEVSVSRHVDLTLQIILECVKKELEEEGFIKTSMLFMDKNLKPKDFMHVPSIEDDINLKKIFKGIIKRKNSKAIVFYSEALISSKNEDGSINENEDNIILYFENSQHNLVMRLPILRTDDGDITYGHIERDCIEGQARSALFPSAVFGFFGESEVGK